MSMEHGELIMEREALIAMVEGLKEKKEDAATLAYETFQPRVYRKLLALTKQDPELAADLTQDTFVFVLKNIHELKEPAAFVTWLDRISASKFRDYAAKRKELLVDEYEDGGSAFDRVEEYREGFLPGEELDREDLKKTLLSIVCVLPTAQREALVLRYFNEISVKEISRIQKVTEGTVKSRLNYGRKALRKALEDYEKKNGIRLHSVAVLPLLLWAFRSYKTSQGISLTAGAASAVFAPAAASTATTATVTTAKAAAATTARTAGKSVATKVIAAVTAAGITAGGVTYALTRPEPEPELIREWSGYGSVYFDSREHRWFELTLEELDSSHVSGHLEVSYLYETEHSTDFEGEGTEEDGTVRYVITFDTPLEAEIGDGEIGEAALIWDEEEQTITIDGVKTVGGGYDAVLAPEGSEESELLFRDAVWKGIGRNGFHNTRVSDRNVFELKVEEMRSDSIRGQLTVYRDGEPEHISGFTGRGLPGEDTVLYEIRLEQPREEKQVILLTVDCFWLEYSLEDGCFRFLAPNHYRAEMLPEAP